MLPGIRQLLLTVHPELLWGSLPINRTNQGRGKKLGIEPTSGSSVRRTKMPLHHCTSPSAFRHPATRDHSDGYIRLHYRCSPLTMGQQGKATPSGIPLPKVPAGGNQL